MYFLRLAFYAVMVSATALGLSAWIDKDPEHAKPDRGERPTAGVDTEPGHMPDVLSAVAASQAAFFEEQQRIVDQQVHDYLDALEAQRLADEAAAAARVAAARSAGAQPVLRPGTGAPHSDAWWWGVANCEQGGRNDPYFGYFSWMDGSAAGLTWEQQVQKSNDLLISVGHEVGPWAESCVRAGYAASPGG